MSRSRLICKVRVLLVPQEGLKVKDSTPGHSYSLYDRRGGMGRRGGDGYYTRSVTGRVMSSNFECLVSTISLQSTLGTNAWEILLSSLFIRRRAVMWDYNVGPILKDSAGGGTNPTTFLCVSCNWQNLLWHLCKCGLRLSLLSGWLGCVRRYRSVQICAIDRLIFVHILGIDLFILPITDMCASP